MLDEDWVKTSLLVPDFDGAAGQDELFKYHPKNLVWADTTLGGNPALNPLPQFTPTCDPRSFKGENRGRLAGMGRDYYERIHTNQRIIYICCGVPQHNNLFRFLTTFYDHHQAVLARTGRAPSWLYTLGNAATTVATAGFQITVHIYTLMRVAMGVPVYKFYYLKEDMSNFYAYQNVILNNIANIMGLSDELRKRDLKPEHKTGGPFENVEDWYNYDKVEKIFKVEGVDQPEVNYRMGEKYFQYMAPDIYNTDAMQDDSHYIDVLKIISRYTLNSKKYIKEFKYNINMYTANELLEVLKKQRKEQEPTIRKYDPNLNDSYFLRGEEGGSVPYPTDKEGGTDTLLKSAQISALSKPIGDGSERDTGFINESIDWIMDENGSAKETFMDEFVNQAKSELAAATRYLRIRVNGDDETTDSFSNSSVPSKLEGRFNATSSDWASKRFDYGSLLSEVPGVSTVMGAIGELLTGSLASVGLDGIAAVFGNALIDIPERYNDSNSNIGSLSYSVDLVSPYANPWSRLTNIVFPLSTILPIFLPKAAGPNSYTSPFLVEIIDPNRSRTHLALPDSLTITRGKGNSGWTKDGYPLCVEVSMSFKNLSNNSSMPINLSPRFSDDQSNFKDYMAILGGLQPHIQIDPIHNLMKNLYNKRITLVNKYASGHYWANSMFGGDGVLTLLRFVQ